MFKILKLKLFLFIFTLSLFFFIGRNVLAFVEYPTNPIYDPIITAEKAYFPSVLKIGASDYRMWYQSNSTPDNSTVAYATSVDGLSWTVATNTVFGLIADNAGHPHVGFADGKYRIWYWNTVSPYTNNAMHYAESVDGITWTNDQAITGNLISATSGLWNSGSYGAVDVIINDNPTNSGTNPFDYKYAMYYDATSGGYEQIALGYSTDGIAWTLYGTGPVLPKGSSGLWDSGYAVFGTIIKDDFWRMWYSGGISASNEGIGCATSIDGLVWAKCPSNPLMSKNDGVAWRNNRTYTPSVIKDGSDYKMWFTGKDTATGNYTVGYATFTSSETGHLYLPETSDGGVSLPSGASGITLNNDSVLNVASNANVVSGGTVIVAGATIALSSFTSGNLTSVDLSVPQTIGGQPVTVGKAVQISSGVNGVPIVLTNLSLGNTSVSIPDDTTILAPSVWNGIILPPKIGTSLGDTPPSGFSIGSTVIEAGSTSSVLLFDKPVQVSLNGVTGSVGYKPAGLTTWTKITATCGGTYDAPTFSTSSFPGECSITNGANTKILTYHFTTFGGLNPLVGALTYTAGANGSITGTTPQTVNYGSDGTPVTAVPNIGYHFVNWSDASTANPRTETNVNADVSIVANFAIDASVSSGGGGGNFSSGGGTGSTVDNVPPGKPILNQLITSTKEKLVNISGSAEPGSRIDLYDKGVLIGRLYNAADNNGIFGQNFEFGVGRHSLTVQAVDSSNNVSQFSDPVIFDIISSVPTAPIILTPQNGISITNATPQIIGVADPNNQIIITVDNNQFTVNSDNKGAWNFTLPNAFALSGGRHTISAVAKDITNKQSSATTLVITKIAIQIPAAVSLRTSISVPSTPGVGVVSVPSALSGRVISVPPPSLINSTTQAVELPGIPVPKVITAGVKVGDVMSFTGTSMPNSDVVIYIHSDQALVYYTRADQFGNWTINHSQIVSELTPGDHTIYAVALDPNNKVKSQPSAISGFTVQRDLWVTIYKYLNWQTTVVALVFSVFTMLWLYRLRVKENIEI